MIIKIEGRTSDSVVRVFECKSYYIKHQGNLVFFVLDDGSELEVVKGEHEVYVMNTEGKTVDRYRWAQC